MIGVMASPSEYSVVREFFELFKTPWEFHRSDRQYEVLLCAGERQFGAKAKLLVVYGSGVTMDCDREQKYQVSGQSMQRRFLSYRGRRLPIYGNAVTFPKEGSRLLIDEVSGQCVAYLDRDGERVSARVGYDLFGEIRTLLEDGQPPANAHIPALELHIEFLRTLITGCGLILVEIPPVPDGYRFVACLTHDVDHPSIRRHKWDHTMWGFLYRAFFGSLFDFIYGRIRVRDLGTNWAAALKLPFVYFGLANDFWREFGDRYLELELGLGSTFFVIPFKDRPGMNSVGVAPRFRAARYGAGDIAGTIKRLLAAGSEIALHGIDAWCNGTKGSEEVREIRRLTGVYEVGVRMHWLYYDEQSPLALEQAGAFYDSTIGYNTTVGYRAGTTQVFKPLQATRLLELPLHVMDTALFYPGHLHLSQNQAKTLVGRLLDDVGRLGGCFTVNWHDRSIAPERLWEDCYRDLVTELKARGAWFATAGGAVSWFRKRRAASFDVDFARAGHVRPIVVADRNNHLPGLRLRIHRARESHESSGDGPEEFVDIGVDESVDNFSVL